MTKAQRITMLENQTMDLFDRLLEFEQQTKEQPPGYQKLNARLNDLSEQVGETYSRLDGLEKRGFHGQDKLESTIGTLQVAVRGLSKITNDLMTQQNQSLYAVSQDIAALRSIINTHHVTHGELQAQIDTLAGQQSETVGARSRIVTSLVARIELLERALEGSDDPSDTCTVTEEGKRFLDSLDGLAQPQEEDALPITEVGTARWAQWASEQKEGN